MKLSVRLGPVKRNPLLLVQGILSLFAMISGLYLMSPLQVYSTANFGAGAIAQTISNPTGIIIFGLLYFASGALVTIGLIKHKKKWREYGLLACFICRLYSLFGTWLTIGFLPLGWLSSFSCLLVTVVAYLAIRWEQKE